MKHILLGDFGQSIDIIEASQRVDLQKKIQQQQSQRLRVKDLQIAKLEARTEQLHLAITALTRFLITRNILSEQDLTAFIEEIDASDGLADGKLSFTDGTLKTRMIIPGQQKSNATGHDISPPNDKE